MMLRPDLLLHVKGIAKSVSIPHMKWRPMYKASKSEAYCNPMTLVSPELADFFIEKGPLE